MSIIYVNETATFKEEVQAIFPLLVDFSNWHKWVPWFLSDPTIDLTISDDEKSLKWEGIVIGRGELTISSEVENSFIEIKILYTLSRLTNATLRIEFNCKEVGETNVRWIYKEKMPFYKAYRNKRKADAISYDLKRGFQMLRDLIQDGTVKSEVKILGVQWGFGYDYVGINHQVPIDEMQEVVIQDFKKLMPYAHIFCFEDKPCPFIKYQFWDKETMEVNFTSCISVIKKPENIQDGMTLGKTQDSRMFAIQHIGGHNHISNAFRTLDYLQLSELIDVNEKIGYRALEFFRFGPLGVPEDEIESDIVIAISQVGDNPYLFY